MSWVLVIGAAWVLLAVMTAVLIGRSVRLADLRAQAAAENQADEPNFVVDPATAPQGMPAATILPFPAPAGDDSPMARPVRDTPTVPGIPVARPPAPGADHADGQQGPIRRTGLG